MGHVCGRDEALEAIFDLLRESVKPLEWEGEEGDCYVTCETESHTYDLVVSDTMERPHDYVWTATAVPHLYPRVKCSAIGRGSFSDVVMAANEHRSRCILSAMGLDQ